MCLAVLLRDRSGFRLVEKIWILSAIVVLSRLMKR